MKADRVINRINREIKSKQPYVLFSGGRDSLVVLDLVRRACESVGQRLKIIHVDTTVAIPDNLEYVKRICKRLGLSDGLNVLRPKRTFFELAQKKGFPTFRSRWCCEHLKLLPVRDFLRHEPPNRVVFDGMRAEESRARRDLPYTEWRNFLGCYLHHPILDWKREDVLGYLSYRGLPANPLYLKGFRRAAECWCGLYKSVKEFKLLRKHYPNFFNKLLDLEESMRSGGSYLFIHGRRVYLRDIT
jgi:phosphoadenosine phosphosulfate reductase